MSKGDDIAERWRKYCDEELQVFSVNPDAAFADEMADFIDSLEARIAELEAAQAWVKVSERLPIEGQIVAYFEPHCKNNPDKGIGSDIYKSSDMCWSDLRADGTPWITKWKPITPPEAT